MGVGGRQLRGRMLWRKSVFAPLLCHLPHGWCHHPHSWSSAGKHFINVNPVLEMESSIHLYVIVMMIILFSSNQKLSCISIDKLL